MPKTPRGRINGPYSARGRWRVVITAPNGTRRYRFFDDLAEARDYIAEARAALKTRHVDVTAAIDAYVKAQRLRGLRDGTVATAKYRLKALFANATNKPMSSISPATAQTLYTTLAGKQRTDTHRNTLKAAKSFFAWAVKNNLADENPFEAIEGVGLRAAGKPQLRINEARKLFAVAWASAATDPGALATVTILLLGLRASEVALMEARDIDDENTLLWIPHSKTAAGVRRLRMPPELGALLAARAGVGRVFPGANRWWVRAQVAAWCKRARVPCVSAHGLRGTHASLAVEGGSTAANVATALGHGDAGRTATNAYIRVLSSTRSTRVPPTESDKSN